MEKETKKIRLVVIDTSVFVDYFRKYQPSLFFFQSILKEERENFLFTAITETELISGQSCSNSSTRIIVLNMLNSFNKIEVNNQIALRAGDLRRNNNIDLPDAIIAATALVNNAELITRNVKDFKSIEGLNVREPY